MKNRNKNTAYNRDYDAPYRVKISVPEINFEVVVPFFDYIQIRPYLDVVKRRVADVYCGPLSCLTLIVCCREHVFGRETDFWVDHPQKAVYFAIPNKGGLYA